MSLVATLKGHTSDVNCIRWFSPKDRWITGGDDNTIRIWVGLFFSYFNLSKTLNFSCVNVYFLSQTKTTNVF
jgi:WD40 repeat protein